jgi:hypothetical protein
MSYGTDLAGRYIAYDMAIAICWAVVGLAFILYTIFTVKKWYKITLDKNEPYLFIPIITGTVGFTLFPFMVGIILKDIFIPEIRIVELLTALITK